MRKGYKSAGQAYIRYFAICVADCKGSRMK